MPWPIGLSPTFEGALPTQERGRVCWSRPPFLAGRLPAASLRPARRPRRREEDSTARADADARTAAPGLALVGQFTLKSCSSAYCWEWRAHGFAVALPHGEPLVSAF